MKFLGWCLVGFTYKVRLSFPTPHPPLLFWVMTPRRGDDQARDFRGKTPADVIGESEVVADGEEPNEDLHEVIKRTLAGGMDLAQDAVLAADEVRGR